METSMKRKWSEKQASDKAKSLLIGAYDIHIHTNPSYGPNCEGFGIDDFEMIEAASRSGLKGICIKNLEFSTIFRDYLTNKWAKKNGFSSCKCYSSLVLNAPVGGINPFAVDFAVIHGAKCIWFPTYSSHYTELMFGWGEFNTYEKDNWFPGIKMKKPKDMKGISIYDADGKLLPEVYETIEITRDASVCLATGHLSPKESYAVCRNAMEMGHKKMILTHPDTSLTLINKEMMNGLAKIGVFIEKTFNSLVNDFNEERIYGYIKDIGTEQFFMSTDTGQPDMPLPVNSFGIMIDEYLKNGFSEDEVRRMIQTIPAFLMEG
jgi:hypothetical protein